MTALRPALPALACLFLALPALSQNGEIRIEVKDSSGAPMQASGRVENLASGVRSGFRTTATGQYTVPTLAPGSYRIEISQPGFTTQTSVIEVGVTSVQKAFTLVPGGANFKVDVVGVTPIPGVEVPVSEIPAPVQTLTSKDFESSQAVDLSELMNRRFNAVHINETQNNPFQPDVNYRGYTASPLLGTPEGISVYMDGVRLNQPFGDIVSWDLIPKIAIGEVALMPGSNPIFGLNTLGGALSLQTKSGASRPGTSVQATGGSFGRRAFEFDHGWSNSKGFNWYVAGNSFQDDGWRVASPTDVKQLFTKIGWQGARTSMFLSGSFAANELVGNGLQETRLLSRNYSSVYTVPDRTYNRAPSFNYSLRHAATNNLTLSGNAYYRFIRAETYNGDANDDSLDQSVYQPSAAEITALRNAGYTGFPTSGATAANTPFPIWRCIAQVILNDEPAEKCNGIINRTWAKQHNWGLSGQASLISRLSAGRNLLTVGAGFDRGSINYSQTAQLGYINPDHSITGLNSYADGIHAGDEDGVPFDQRVQLEGSTKTTSFYAADTLSLAHGVTLSASGRVNHTIIDNRDRIIPSGTGSLTGRHTFTRLNPSFGITWAAAPAYSVYAAYNEGSRAPTSIELGCADPAQPCKLPNSLAGDPPLRQVVTRTIEGGIRSGAESRVAWNAGYFFTRNNDDILFVSSSSTGLGYFKNFGATRRQGIEIGLRSRLGRVTLGGGYTFLDATFQSTEIVNGTGNSTNNLAVAGSRGLEGTIQVKPGNRIPLIPQHNLKAWADYQITSKASIDLDFRAVGMSYARGNENNLSRPDGTYYLGAGTSPGYGVTNIGARYQIVRMVQAFIQVRNLFDHRYYSGAQLGATSFTADGNFIARPLPAVGGQFPIPQSTFYAPGAPRTITGGLKFTF